MEGQREKRADKGLMDATGNLVDRATPDIADGRYALSAAMDDALRAASDASARGQDRRAHPAFAFVVALGGLGADIGTVCANLGLPFDTGAMLGRCRIVFDRPLLVDHVYEVSAQVVSIIRKSSRRFGAADHLRLSTQIRVAGRRFAVVELTMIVPVVGAMAPA